MQEMQTIQDPEQNPFVKDQQKRISANTILLLIAATTALLLIAFVMFIR